MAGIRLSRGQKVPLTNGQTITVIDELGMGGQGIVYRVRLDNTGEEKALKWYFPKKIKDGQGGQKFYARLRDNNISQGSPSDAFVWPEALTEWVNGTFGYVMKLYPPEYKGFPRYLIGTTKFADMTAKINAGLNISTAFKHLHNYGWNYQDLNDGNFAIDPKTGKVLICDNDNVVGHGQDSGVLGKPRYMAPEIVRGEAKPNKTTDRYSLAVILFMLLIRNHPLEGKKTNVPALTYKYQKRFFGDEPLFIFDSKDNSNAPRESVHAPAIKFWPYLPEFMQDAFRKSFSKESLLKAEGRFLEEQWIHLFMRLKSSMIKCANCGDIIFAAGDSPTVCPNCHKNINVAGYLKFAKRTDVNIIVPLSSGAKLYDYHITNNTDSSESYEKVVATVLEKPGKIGLRNDSKNAWTISAPNGKTAIKNPGETAVMHIGFKIDFGNKTVAEVVSNK